MAGQSIGRYEIREELGRGGMAVVYRAHDPRFRREVAVKILPPEFHHFPEYRARFEREALAVASLEHRAIVPVHDYGEADGRLYLVMRHMPGGSLADRLLDGPLPLGEAALILTRIAPALDYAHSRHILHRDLKPANILFDDQGMPYLTDFGIVKLLEEDTSGLTGTGNLIGTPKYMSPEQALAGKALDGRSDIYALGVILFEMLAGQAPFVADTPLRTALMHVNAPIPDIHGQQAGLPRAVQPVIERALAKEPGDRYPTAAALAAALRELPPDPPPPDAALLAAAAAAGAPPAVSPHDETVKEPLPTPRPTLSPSRAKPSPEKPSPTPTVQAGAPPPARRAAPWWIYALLGVVGVVLIAWALSNVVGGAETPEATEFAEVAAVTSVPAVAPEATATDEPATATDEPTTPEPNQPPAVASLGDTWTRPADDMTMVYVPAGSFLMGSADDDLDADVREFPRHRVSLDAFWIDRTEVTNAQLERCAANGACRESGWSHDIDLNGADFPVVGVTWNYAEAYCGWAGARLPTEAEWEYASRGPAAPKFPWGDTFDGELVNYCDANCELDSADKTYDDGWARSAPVGSYPAGASWVGALDMAGNAAEWVQDLFGIQYYENSPSINPTGPVSGSTRVLRGGGWLSRWYDLRAAQRAGISPTNQLLTIGFRCVSASGE